MNNSAEYVVGQCWLNHADLPLGLGLVIAVDRRCVQIHFLAVDEVRSYAIEQAPLCRISYRIGEEIQNTEGLALSITDISEQDGIYIYTGVNAEGNIHQIKESELKPQVKFDAPLDRLLNGYIDRHKDYKLKIQTLNLLAKLHQSNSHGLVGARTEHIAHQVYIANEVAQRFAPRVLLSDEVGLGKTIEAGLITHHQIISGRASRVLIIVPHTLVHQWFIEMLRRFNLSFSIFNQERYQAITEQNPFETEQLIIASLDFLMSDEQILMQAHSASWDLVIVDEAHHLYWAEAKPSLEYLAVEQFAEKCLGLLLLTATPEQLGLASHFARLRLLDSDRFHSLAAFKEEEAKYQQVNQLAQQLLQLEPQQELKDFPSSLVSELNKFIDLSHCQHMSDVLSMLLDQHGTGRVLFRNTRAAISGFPKRILKSYALTRPALYQDIDYQDGFTLESYVAEKQWLAADPRVLWLVEKLRDLRPEKVLVITTKASTAIALEKFLRLTTNIRVSAFHERLSVIERDRAAAYFAEAEQGAECLICSEIGSEGRNFQFAHQLILFDLPLNPDVLEQRIGRLDRIGQQHSITIHVPYIENTAMAILFYWYHQGMNLFEQSCSFGFSIYQMFEQNLLALMRCAELDKDKLAMLIELTKSHMLKMQQQAEAGRDRLLELSSCNKPKAQKLIEAIEQEEDPAQLQHYMAQVFNAYGVSHESHSEYTEILRPSEHMKTAYFPGLKDEGNTVTYSRQKALVREDIEFLSFEHPMVREVMEMILNEGDGSAVLCTMSLAALPVGTILVEIFFTVSTIVPDALELNRYLPLTPTRVLISQEGKNLAAAVSHEQLSQLCKKIKRQLAHSVVQQLRSTLEDMVQKAEIFASKSLPNIKEQALTKLNNGLGTEMDRLVALKKVNPNIRQQEIDALQQQITLIQNAINQASLKMEAMRVIVNQ